MGAPFKPYFGLSGIPHLPQARPKTHPPLVDRPTVPPTNDGGPIQAVLWLEWDSTALSLQPSNRANRVEEPAPFSRYRIPHEHDPPLVIPSAAEGPAVSFPLQ